MRTLITAAGAYLTGDEIAEAVLEYWTELTNNQRTAIVDMPFLDGAEQEARVQLAIGWGLPIASVTSSSNANLHDPALVEALLLRAHPRMSYGDVPFNAREIGEENDAWEAAGPHHA